MTVNTIAMYDATSENEKFLPPGQLVAGYDTQAGGGTGFIAWTAAQWAAHTKPYPAVHVDQDANASDPLADVLDIEAGAATESEIVSWLTRARTDYEQVKRPGQRNPALYCSVANVPSIVALLQSAKLSGVPFWVADYSISGTEAARLVSTATGPYPAIGYQYSSGANFDDDVMSLPWVTTVSKAATPPSEDEQPMMFNTNAFAPFPAGKYTKLYLWRDFSATTVRVAALAGGKFDLIDNYSTSPDTVTVVDLPANTEAVSLGLITGTAPVGYLLV